MMRKLLNLTWGGAALCALAVGSLAYAQAAHVMRVALPDGGEAVIRYTGERPDVTIKAGPDAFVTDSLWREPLGWRTPTIDAMFADMDRQFAALRTDIERLGSTAGTPTAIASAPPGSHVERRVAGSCAPSGQHNQTTSAHGPLVSEGSGT